MIISHKYKFIFIHILRNAGSSIIEYLADKLGKDVLNTDSVSCKKNGNVYLLLIALPSLSFYKHVKAVQWL